MIGAQASSEQLEKILSYIDIGKQEGAEVLTGGKRNVLDGAFKDGYYVEPTIFKGHNKMRIFQEEIFGPVVSVTTFKDEDEALAHRQRHALRPRRGRVDARRQHRLSHGPRDPGRAASGPTATTLYPAHAAFGGYKQSGIGRETHKHDARPLPADQEPAGELQPEGARLLLGKRAVRATRASRRRRAGARPDRAPAGEARPAHVPPIRRLLRRQQPDVLSARRLHGRAVAT